MEPEVKIHLQMVGWALLPALFGQLLAWRMGLFAQKPLPEPSPTLRGEDLLGLFFVYLTTQLIAVPLLIHGILRGMGTDLIEVQAKGGSFYGWLQLSNTVTAALVTTFYWLIMPNHRQLWRDSRCGGSYLRDSLLAVGVWVISYPWMIVVSQLFAAILATQTSEPPPSQVAVQHVVAAAPHPLLRFSLVLVVGVAAPIAEELLFRGGLQSWLRHRMDRGLAIGFTSLIFSLFHFAPSQGVTNLALIPSLFVLSLFLGWIYDKQRSIWASIALHMLFNLTSVVLILLG